jgi:hypothetical protein
MHLKSAIIVKQTIEQVTKFFYEPTSLAKWDRSVAEMIPGSSEIDKAGATFDTIAPSGMKMSYEVTELDSDRSVKILLTKSKMFKKAIWHFEFDPVSEGTQITCHVYFTLRPLYLFLYPVLYLNKRALMRDLKYFETALNENAG